MVVADGVERTSFLDVIKKNAWLTIGVGVMLVISGFLAMGAPLLAGLSITIFVGALLLFNGFGLIVLAFKSGSFGKGFFISIAGILTVIVGAIVMSKPGEGLASLTLFLALFFLFTGLSDIIWSFQLKPEKGWGWTLFNGIITLLLGLMIWRQFPVSGVWAIGTLVGIRFMFSGFTLITFGVAAKTAVKEMVSDSSNI